MSLSASRQQAPAMAERLNILHVLETVGQLAAGPTHSVSGICRALCGRGHHVELHVLDMEGTPPPLGRVELWRYPWQRRMPKLGASRAMRLGLKERAGSMDIFHVHGLWRLPHIYAARAVKDARTRLLFSPRGMLEPYALEHHGAPKRLFWLLAQKSALEAAHCLHATSEQEYESIRRVGLKAPVAVVANGVELSPQELPDVARERELLFLARIHPIKAIDRLLEAWAQVEARFPDWRLRIVGPDSDGHLASLRELVQRLRIQRVTFEGPLFGADKAHAFARASLYVLPSHSENFGISVAEALVAGLPAICSRSTPWRGVEEHRCGFWVENDVSSLAACLSAALALSPRMLAEMGARGKAWVERDFGWEHKAEQLEAVYSWLQGRGPRPEVVRTR